MVASWSGVVKTGSEVCGRKWSEVVGSGREWSEVVGSGREWSGVVGSVGSGREWSGVVGNGAVKDASGREWSRVVGSGPYAFQSLSAQPKMFASGREWSGVARKHSRALAVSQRCLLAHRCWRWLCGKPLSSPGV